MLVAAMVSLNGSIQQQLANVHEQVGTGIKITYAVNDSHGIGQTSFLATLYFLLTWVLFRFIFPIDMPQIWTRC